jgi:hypothetical protein
LKVVSLSVGLPREVEWEGNTVLTSIFKEPVDRRLRVTTLNFEGDEQSDLTVHGGVDKAVYVYPFEHYAEWRRELQGVEFPQAGFGENLTTEGPGEDVRIGDRFRVGSAEFVVTQPRMPCYKLGIRFGRPDMPKRFLRSGHSGFYLAVTPFSRRANRKIEPAHAGVFLARAGDGEEYQGTSTTDRPKPWDSGNPWRRFPFLCTVFCISGISAQPVFVVSRCRALSWGTRIRT